MWQRVEMQRLRELVQAGGGQERTRRRGSSPHQVEREQEVLEAQPLTEVQRRFSKSVGEVVAAAAIAAAAGRRASRLSGEA